MRRRKGLSTDHRVTGSWGVSQLHHGRRRTRPLVQAQSTEEEWQPLQNTRFLDPPGPGIAADGPRRQVYRIYTHPPAIGLPIFYFSYIFQYVNGRFANVYRLLTTVNESRDAKQPQTPPRPNSGNQVRSARGLVAGRPIDRIVPQDYPWRGCGRRILHEPRTKGFRVRARDSLGRLFGCQRRSFPRRRRARARIPDSHFRSWFRCRHLCGPAPPQAPALLSQVRRFAHAIPVLRALQRKVILYPPQHDISSGLRPPTSRLRADRELFKFRARNGASDDSSTEPNGTGARRRGTTGAVVVSLR
jgi:hypothetical protein